MSPPETSTRQTAICHLAGLITLEKHLYEGIVQVSTSVVFGLPGAEMRPARVAIAGYLLRILLQFSIAAEGLPGNTGIKKEPCENHGLSPNFKCNNQLQSIYQAI